MNLTRGLPCLPVCARRAVALLAPWLASLCAAWRAADVFAHIEQDVAQREADLARGLQSARVITVGEHAPPALQLAIHGAGDANAQALHAARQRTTILRFRDQMQVIALHREVYDSKAKALIARGDG